MRDQQCNMVIADGFMNMDINKVMESSRHWKLANDVELLKRLEKFSENIINNASLTLTNMDNLEDCLNETFLRVRTVANKFQATADNQFIENRVQEEEDFVLANEKKADLEDTQVSPETSKAQLLESIRECQNALSRKFETVQLSGIDSEDEMANSSPVVLVPKNVYKERRLPHLIGGEKFIADETLGLMSYTENADDSVESEEDMDETDRSSYYSNSLKKSLDDQGETAISSLSSSALPADPVQAGSPFRNVSSKVSLEDKSEPVSEDDRVLSSASRIPVRRDFLTDDPGGLFDEDEAPLFVEKTRLFAEKSVLIDEPIASESPEAENIQSSSNPDPNIGSTREKLLAGRNFTSFKEDLSRVLSQSRPYTKRTPDPSRENDASSPVIHKSSPRRREDETEEDGEVSSCPVSPDSQSTPESSSLPPTGRAKLADPSVAHGENIGSVTLPDVATNKLENLAKGRPKLKGNRRPPSRKHRQGGSLDAGSPPANLSASVHSDDASNSVSTQPGSNILSPATDEEDLFVLPAYDLPTDPPNRGLFFNNTLLSPGASIDDGSLSTSPLFPPSLPSAKHDSQGRASIVEPPIKREPHPPTVKKSVRSEPIAPVDSVGTSVEKTFIGAQSDSPTDDLFFRVQPAPRSASGSTVGKIQDPAEVPDLFSSTTSITNLLSSEDDDIFSSRIGVKTTTSSSSAVKKPDPSPEPDLFASSSVISKLSSSPPLFSDWSEPARETKSGTKTKTTSLKSGLQWDLLGSDDDGEDLFRSSKRESRPASKIEEPKPKEPGLMPAEKKEDIFSPANFEKSEDAMFFEEDSYSSTDIFSDTSSFMRLSLPSNAKESLFASDDDDDDDSLFKTSKKSGSDAKPAGASEIKTSKLPSSDSTSREMVKDPLMSMDGMD